MGNADDLSKGSGECGSKLAASVRCDGGRHAKTREPVMEEGTRDSFGCDIGNRNRFRSKRETVDTRERYARP